MAILSANGTRPLQLNAMQMAALEKYADCVQRHRTYFPSDDRQETQPGASIIEVKFRSVKRGVSYLLLDEHKHFSEAEDAQCEGERTALEKLLRPALE